MSSAAVPAQDSTACQTSLEALRACGAHLHDPVRFHYLEAMAARMAAQPVSVRQLLAARFEEAAADLRQRLAPEASGMVQEGPDAANSPAVASVSQGVKPGAAARAASPLARLNREIAARALDAHHAHQGDASHAGIDLQASSPSDMKSVRRFAQTWSRIATERQLALALTRGPEAAGPLNSHNLMLRAMSLMNELSPDYLRRFLAHADALLMLDQLNQLNTLKDGKAAQARRGRAKK